MIPLDTVTEMLNTTKCSQENCREISTNLTLLQDKVDSWPSAGTESVCQCTDQIAGLETLLYEVSIYIHIIYISSTYLLTKVTGSLCPAEQCRDTAQQLELTQRRVESVQEKVTITINNINIVFILPQGDDHQPDQVLRGRVWADVRAAGQRGQHCRLPRHRAGQLGRQYPGCAVVFMLQRWVCQK